MAELFEIADIVGPVFLVIGIGYVLRGLRFITPEVNGYLSRLVFYVAAPALLLRSVAQTPLGEAVAASSLITVAAVTVFTAFGVYLAAGRLVPARRGVVAQGSHRANMVFIGLPVIINAYGDSALGLAAILIAAMVVLYNFLAVVVLLLPHRAAGGANGGPLASLGSTALEVLRNPLILGSGTGLIISGFGWELPVAADRTLELVGRIAMPLALLSVGVGIDLRRLRREWGLTGVVCVLKLVIYPALAWGGLALLGCEGAELAVPVLIVASPTAVVSYVMAQEMKGDEQLAGAIVIGTTLASLFTISGWLLFLR